MSGMDSDKLFEKLELAGLLFCWLILFLVVFGNLGPDGFAVACVFGFTSAAFVASSIIVRVMKFLRKFNR